MNYQILEDYLFALRRERDLYGHLGDEQNESLYDRYADSIDFPIRHIRYGTSLTVDEVAVYRKDLLRLFSPHLIQQLVSAGREQSTYKAVYELACCMERVSEGKKPSLMSRISLVLFG